MAKPDAPVVDADQVVRAALRIRMHRAVEQDDGDTRLVERRHDPQVAGVARRQPFERREEHAIDALGDVLLDSRPRGRGAAAAGDSPPPHRNACARASGADSRPWTSGSKISMSGRSGTRTPNVQSTAAVDCLAPYVGARADAALHEPLHLQVTHRPPDRDSRRPEARAEFGFAGHPGARRAAARTRCPCGARRRPPGTWAPSGPCVACPRCYDNLVTFDNDASSCRV